MTTTNITARSAILSQVANINEAAVENYHHGKYFCCLRELSDALSLLIETLETEHHEEVCDKSTDIPKASMAASASEMSQEGILYDEEMSSSLYASSSWSTEGLNYGTAQSIDDISIEELLGPVTVRKAYDFFCHLTSCFDNSIESQLAFEAGWERVLQLSIMFNLAVTHCVIGKLDESMQLLDLCLNIASETSPIVSNTIKAGNDGHQAWDTMMSEILIKIYLMKVKFLHLTQEQTAQEQQDTESEQCVEMFMYLHGAYDISVKGMGNSHACTNVLRQTLVNALFDHGHFTQALALMDQRARILVQAATSRYLDNSQGQVSSTAPAA